MTSALGGVGTGTGPVRSCVVDDAPVIRIAGPADVAALAALRRAWTAEDDGPGADEGGADEGFEARFGDWFERESARRVFWLAEAGGIPAGMVTLVTFERMPRPGRDPGAWGYLSNAYVAPAHRSRGIGSALLRALLAHAAERGFTRVVLHPSERAVPLYQRFGFAAASDLLVREM